LKAKIKEDAESQFGAIKPKLLADVTEFLIQAQNLTCLQNFLKNGCKLLREKIIRRS
jgi:hypothetical protein